MSVLAKKKFGQNFLHDDFYLAQIIQSMPDSTNDVLEIGPGLGDLTAKLLTKKNVLAVEVDSDLIPNLESRFKDAFANGSFRLIHADILEAWGAVLSSSECHFDIVANLPYYIATHIIMRALTDKRIDNLLVMVQREVAEKFCAQSKTREFGALSVICDTLCIREIAVNVPPEAFEPKPKVFSSVLKLQKRAEPIIHNDLIDSFSAFLKEAFSAPRKTLIKNLSHTRDRSTLENFFAECTISLNIRPHELETQQFVTLFSLLNHSKKL